MSGLGPEGFTADATVRLNGEERGWFQGNLTEWLVRLGVDPARRGIAIAVNGRVIPRTEWAAHAIAPGDDMEIVGAVAGG